ncbi:CPBP family intramembrane glutamic endopeptidase [Rubrivirga sp. IMCC45206]|uniref:CPBP family intramembrane glutamic endopeptidase n=1 Tax=Rubrivirga sp. IMCC45206 TaxID=3391614 RepID=UPI00398FE484
MDYLLNAALLAVVTAPPVALALWTSPSRRWPWAVLFLGLLALDDLAVTLPFAVRALDVVGGDWNWVGKALCVAWATLFLAVGPVSFQEAGVTLRQHAGSVRPALLATLTLTAASAGIGAAFGGGPFGVETLAYQLTMPGLAEELVYRGMLIAVLHRALPGAEGAAWWWPVVLTAVAFGGWHGLGVDDRQVSFDALSASFPFVGGLAYGWLRERTGSLLFPTLAHNLGNTAALVGGLVG